MTTASTVFLTVPKYVAITTKSSALTKIRPAPAEEPAGARSPAYSSGYTSNDEATAAATPKAKKRRLDHLTWEEKVQRKKLKNRVAAQTSRDRKKARMEEMDYEINNLNEKTELLQNKCESLQAINDSLLAKNHKLDMELESMRQELSEIKAIQKQQKQPAAVQSCAGCASILTGSAVSNTDPLQQGTQMDTQSTQEKQQLKKSQSQASLWRIVALCLLYKTCCSSTKSMTKSSMLAASKNWPKVCSQISQQTWKLAMERAMKLLPKLQASQSDCLDQWWGPQQSAWNPAEIQMMA